MAPCPTSNPQSHYSDPFAFPRVDYFYVEFVGDCGYGLAVILLFLHAKDGAGNEQLFCHTQSRTMAKCCANNLSRSVLAGLNNLSTA
jgi:hypothetical protein